MGSCRDVYDFAAKAGALEGYVYPKEMDVSYLPKWIEHIVQGYRMLPEEVREEVQDLCNATIGRAIQSLLPVIGEDHDAVKKLKSIVTDELPSSPDDFRRKNRISRGGRDIPMP
ncbi:MAG: hypothetical protein ABSE25_05725 [Syntrophorhabdales bacterium]|jgi:predicted transcriptional regulator